MSFSGQQIHIERFFISQSPQHKTDYDHFLRIDGSKSREAIGNMLWSIHSMLAHQTVLPEVLWWYLPDASGALLCRFARKGDAARPYLEMKAIHIKRRGQLNPVILSLDQMWFQDRWENLPISEDIKVPNKSKDNGSAPLLQKLKNGPAGTMRKLEFVSERHALKCICGIYDLLIAEGKSERSFALVISDKPEEVFIPEDIRYDYGFAVEKQASEPNKQQHLQQPTVTCGLAAELQEMLVEMDHQYDAMRKYAEDACANIGYCVEQMEYNPNPRKELEFLQQYTEECCHKMSLFQKRMGSLRKRFDHKVREHSKSVARWNLDEGQSISWSGMAVVGAGILTLCVIGWMLLFGPPQKGKVDTGSIAVKASVRPANSKDNAKKSARYKGYKLQNNNSKKHDNDHKEILDK